MFRFLQKVSSILKITYSLTLWMIIMYVTQKRNQRHKNECALLINVEHTFIMAQFACKKNEKYVKKRTFTLLLLK